MPTPLKVRIRNRWYTVEVGDLDAPVIEVMVDGQPVHVEVDHPAAATKRGNAPVKAISSGPAKSKPDRRSRPSRSESERGASSGSGPQPVKIFRSPMPGVIVSVAVKTGDQVVPGDAICVLEAMKMQQTLKAEWAGVIKSISVQPGKQMQSGETIAELE